jgi:Autophagy protein 16 (ATG16)
VRTKDIALLQRKVRDREEEIKEGKKLIEQVQDEMVSLNLQLNMAEQRSEKLEAENKELVRRWMKKMGEEADRMNEESKW